MKKAILLALVAVVVVLAAVGQAMYAPKPPNCEPASVVVAVATLGNDVFAKASLTGKEMYQLDWKTLQWTELPLDTSIRFETNPHLWSYLDDKRVVKLEPTNPYLVEIGGQDLRFCLPNK